MASRVKGLAEACRAGSGNAINWLAMNLRNFFAELKRRNVYKVAVAYAVVGWLVMQIAATVVPALHLPDGITTAVVVLILLGFPIAVVIAWAFEMTPTGMKRTENVSPNEYIPQWSARKFAALIVTLALLAAGLLVFQMFRSKSISPARLAASTALEKSIAVLPFLNESGDRGDHQQHAPGQRPLAICDGRDCGHQQRNAVD